MFDPRLETSAQMPALRDLILKLVKSPADVPRMAELLDKRDIFAFSDYESISTPHDWVPAAWCHGQRIRPQFLVWGWFFPDKFRVLTSFNTPLSRVNSWYELNPWHYDLSARHGLPLLVMANLRTVVNNLRAEKEADYQRRKAMRLNAKRNLLATDSDEDFDFVD